jgi:hypothetical protein
MCLDVGLGRLSSPSQLLSFSVEFVNFWFVPVETSHWFSHVETCHLALCLHAVLLILAWFFISIIFSFVSTSSSVIVYACVYTVCYMHYKIKECETDGDVATDCNIFVQQWRIGSVSQCYSSLYTFVLWK